MLFEEQCDQSFEIVVLESHINAVEVGNNFDDDFLEVGAVRAATSVGLYIA